MASRKKMTVFLDLDESIISAQEYETINPSNPKVKKFKYSVMDQDFYVFERPNLQPFLDFCFKNFNVSVWTAASRSYMTFIVKNIIQRKRRKIEYALFSDHCDLSDRKYRCMKSLKMLWHRYGLDQFDSSNTVIIDDNADLKKYQSAQTIVIKPFKFNQAGSEKDDVLMGHVKPLLEKFLRAGRVRSPPSRVPVGSPTRKPKPKKAETKKPVVKKPEVKPKIKKKSPTKK